MEHEDIGHIIGIDNVPTHAQEVVVDTYIETERRILVTPIFF